LPIIVNRRQDLGKAFLLESIYQNILAGHPGIAKILRDSGRLPLDQYTGKLYNYRTESIQPREDFIEVVSAYSRRLLGSESAKLLERHLENSPVVLTANHHGVDYKYITVQGTIAFSLPKIQAVSAEVPPIIPVLACGIVPLSNYSFPRGIILSRKIEVPVSPADSVKTFLKVPLIPSIYSHSLVDVTGPITRRMVSYAAKRLRKLGQEGKLFEKEVKCLSILLGEYIGDGILSLPDYSEQAVVLNPKVWKRMFAPSIRPNVPELAYLEMERVVTGLLERDLQDKESLIYNLLFDPELRKALLESLDGHFGCWDLGKLRMLSDFGIGDHLESEDVRGCGTVFFLNVSDEGRRIPLIIRENGPQPTLTGVIPGRNISVPLAPDDLRQMLREKKLLPGLFLSFTTLAFARGIRCIGGFHQVDYLPGMQQGVIRALESRGLHDWAEKCARVATENFLTGMNIMLALYPDGKSEPAGAVEIIAAGGLTEDHLEKIKALTVDVAILSGIMNIRPKPIVSRMKNIRFSTSCDNKVLEQIENEIPRFEL
jgi:hypothetical protein